MNRRRDVTIALVALLALAVGVYGAFVRHLPGAHPWTVEAVVTDTTQIVPGSPVRTAGVDVGTVQAVRHGPGTMATLELAVRDAGRPLHADATAAIRPRLFLEGSYYVALDPGSPAAPALDEHATIPPGQTSVPVSFSTVLSTFDRPVRDSLITILSQSAIGLRAPGAPGLRRGIAALGPAFRDGAVATQAALGRRPDDVARLIVGSDRVTRALADEAPALGDAITAFARVTGALAARETDLTATLRETAATMREAPAPLERTRRALPPLTRFARALDPALRAAPPALDGAAELLDQVDGLTRAPELPRLLAVARPVARGVTRLAPRLERLFPRVTRVSGCVTRQAIPMLDAKLDDGKLSTGQTVWQEIAHDGVNLVSLSQNFDAAGPYTRFITIQQPRELALASVPGVGVLVQDAISQTFDARPAWNGPVPPALHPEVPCATQPLTDFQAPKATIARGRDSVRGAIR